MFRFLQGGVSRELFVWLKMIFFFLKERRQKVNNQKAGHSEASRRILLLGCVAWTTSSCASWQHPDVYKSGRRKACGEGRLIGASVLSPTTPKWLAGWHQASPWPPWASVCVERAHLAGIRGADERAFGVRRLGFTSQFQHLMLYNLRRVS